LASSTAASDRRPRDPAPGRPASARGSARSPGRVAARSSPRRAPTRRSRPGRAPGAGSEATAASRPPPLGVDGRVAGRSDLVADPPHGDDRRGVPELAAQLADVHVDGARVAGERVAPHPLEQLVAREHEAAVVEQLPEQVELLRRELYLLAVHARLAPAGVDFEIAVDDLLRLHLAAVAHPAAPDRPP